MTDHSKSLQVKVNHLCILLNGTVVAPAAFWGYFEFCTTFYEMLLAILIFQVAQNGM
jgi:hypothetical protein